MIKIKSKKGTVILIISSLAFLIAAILLLNVQSTSNNFMGNTEFVLIELSREGNNRVLFIEQAAKFSLAHALNDQPRAGQPLRVECGNKFDTFRSCEEKLKKSFGTSFEKYLTLFNEAYQSNLKLKDYTITVEPYGTDEKVEGINLKGVSNINIILDKENVKYQIKPNFSLKLNKQELQALSEREQNLEKQYKPKQPVS